MIFIYPYFLYFLQRSSLPEKCDGCWLVKIETYDGLTMNGQSEEVRAYLRWKMKECDFEMCIDPDKGYIPFCGVCRDTYEKYKGGDTCDMEHSEACLWYAYFWSKIRDINPDVTVKRASARVAAVPSKAPIRAPSKGPPPKVKPK